MAPRNATVAAAAAAAASEVSASTPLSPPASPSPSPSTSPARRNAKNKNNSSSNNSNNWWHPTVLERTVAYVKQDFESIVATSPFLQTAEPNAQHIALFSRHEIITGSRIGTGGFSVVYEIVGFALDAEITAKLSPSQAELRRHYQEQVVSDMSASSSQPSVTSSRFVLKHLQERLLAQPKAFACAASDLAVEAAFMSSLHHANICQVRGLPIQGLDALSACCSKQSSGSRCMHDGYFIILDRLHDTLDQCIKREELEQQQQQQQQQQQSMNNSNNSNSMTNSNATPTATTMNRLSRASLEKKTKQALQIAQALAYLHERRIVFRDLKPSNIGLDKDGNIQLFDFGLCRELPVSTSLVAPCPTTTKTIVPCASASYNKSDRSNIYNNNGENQDDDDADFYDFCCNSIDDPNNCFDDDGAGAGGYSSPYCDEVFEMSGVGTRRYMAVEIINTGRYNCKADVYSWAMVMYEMLTLHKPFAMYSMEDHQLFCCQNGERPSLHQRLLYKTSPSSNRTNTTSHDINNSNNQLQQQHDSYSSSLAVRRMIAKVLEQSWCESVCNRLDSQQVCQAISAILQTMQEMRNNCNDNSIRTISSSSNTAAAASAAKLDKQTPDSPVGVNDIRLLLFPLALEYYYGVGGYDSGGSGAASAAAAAAAAAAADDDDSSLLVTAADFRDDAPTTSPERQGQEILLLPKRSSSQGGESIIPSHLFLPDIQPLALSHHHYYISNEEGEEHQDVHGNDDDDDRDNDSDNDDEIDVQLATDIGGVVYRPPL